MTYVQYGSGVSRAAGWMNFDASPTLRLAKLPIIGRLIPSPFPRSTRYGDIVKGLPVSAGSCDGIYASHILEHLSRNDCAIALKRTLQMLKPGGRFRLIVPDLEGRARLYLADKTSAAADRFMRSTHLGFESATTSVERIRRLLGNSYHRWMWDEATMTESLREAGFVDIRRCRFSDSGDPMFDAVEEQSRFVDENLQIAECAMEAFRPRV